MIQASPTGRVLIALTVSMLFAAVQVLAQIVPGPVVPSSTYPVIEGRCEIAFGTGSSSHTVACGLPVAGVDYGPGLVPRFVPIGKQLVITDVSAKCVTASGDVSGVYVAYAELEADGYSKHLPLQSIANDISSVVRIGTFPTTMTARAGSQVLIRAVQNRNYTTSTSTCIVGFIGYLKNY